MNNYSKMLLLFLCILFFTTNCTIRTGKNAIDNKGLVENTLKIEIVEWSDTAIIKKGDKGTETNLYGFEGGTVIKLNGIYNLFTAEMADKPWNVKMRLAHWKSMDGFDWKRVSTLVESSGEFTGRDERAACWSPMPFYNTKKQRWNMFYVTYKAKPNNDTVSFVNHEGRIWRAESQVQDMDGIGGPYKDIEVVLKPGKESDPWEGLQGVDSYYIYEAGKKYYAFYGSCHTQKLPVAFFGVGLATAPSMEGPWKRMTQSNPVNFGLSFAENPIITKVDNGLYIAIFDTGGKGIGYSTSRDGIQWTKGKIISIERKDNKWWTLLRTPMCLIREVDGNYTVYFTAFTGGDYSNFVKNDGFACIGRVRLKLTY